VPAKIIDLRVARSPHPTLLKLRWYQSPRAFARYTPEFASRSSSAEWRGYPRRYGPGTLLGRNALR